jgi:tetratricopeptide (TPR) repeat protein
MIAVYSNSLSVPFTFDDPGAIVDNATIRQLWPPWQALTPPGGLTVAGRPVLNFSFALDYARGGTAVGGYHATNLVIHLLAVLALFGIVRRTLRCVPCRSLLAGDSSSGSRARSLPQANAVALAVALLWAVHPLQTESVTYLSQRAESLMGLFYLLTLYCFIRGVAAARPHLWHGCAILTCLLGMATKEVMVSAPLIVLLYDRTFVSGSFREAWIRRRRLYLGLAATWILLAWLVAGEAGRGGTAGFGAGVSWPAYALTQCRAIPHYLRLAFWPHPLVLDYGTEVVHHAAAAAPFALLLALLAVGTLLALWRRPALGFAGAWFFAILAPTSSVVPVATQTIAEHRMYLPLAAVIALAVCGLHALMRRPGLTLVFTFALALPLGWLTVQRNADYRSALALWSDTVARCPDNARTHCNLGFALFEAGQLPEAIAHYQRALQLQPDYAEAHNNLGNALAAAGRPAEAAAQFREAQRLGFDPAEVHFNLANALAQSGQVGESLPEYQAALRQKPDLAAAHNNLGTALVRVQRIPEAAAEFQTALRLEPDNAQAHGNLGNALVELGRLPEAIAQYEEAVRLVPDSVENHFNLGNALARSGRWSEAAAQFEKTLELRPDFAPAQTMLARLRSMGTPRSRE